MRRKKKKQKKKSGKNKNKRKEAKQQKKSREGSQESTETCQKNKQEKPRGKIRLRKMKKSPGRRGTRTVTTPRISKEGRSPSRSRRPEAHCPVFAPLGGPGM